MSSGWVSPNGTNSRPGWYTCWSSWSTTVMVASSAGVGLAEPVGGQGAAGAGAQDHDAVGHGQLLGPGREARTRQSMAVATVPSAPGTGRSTRSARSTSRSATPDAARSATTSSGGVQHGGVLRTAHPAGEVGAVVGHHQEGAAEVQRPRGHAEGGAPLGGGELEVEGHGQVVADDRFPGRDVVGDPQAGDAVGLGQVGRLAQPHRREVDAGHLPALGGEPDGIAPLAARQVERSPRGHPGHLGRQEAVGLAGPDQVGRVVALVPGDGVDHGSAGSWAGANSSKAAQARGP